MKLYVFTFMDPDKEVGAVTAFTRKEIDAKRKAMVSLYPWASFAKVESLAITITPPERPTFATGDKVSHDVFGHGVVTGYKDGAIRIQFQPPVGTKELQMAFCMHKLRKGHGRMRTVQEMMA